MKKTIARLIALLAVCAVCAGAFTACKPPEHTVTVRYISAHTGSELAEAFVLNVAEGGGYDVSARTQKEIENYERLSLEGDAVGTASGDVTVSVGYGCAPDSRRLGGLDGRECVEFLLARGVLMPAMFSDINEELWRDRLMLAVRAVDADARHDFSDSIRQLSGFLVDCIRAANGYWGVSGAADILTLNGGEALLSEMSDEYLSQTLADSGITVPDAIGEKWAPEVFRFAARLREEIAYTENLTRERARAERLVQGLLCDVRDAVNTYKGTERYRSQAPDGKPLLSQMSAAQCVGWMELNQIRLPAGFEAYGSEYWANAALGAIKQAEANPRVRIVFDYPYIERFAQQAAAAFGEYQSKNGYSAEDMYKFVSRLDERGLRELLAEYKVDIPAILDKGHFWMHAGGFIARVYAGDKDNAVFPPREDLALQAWRINEFFTQVVTAVNDYMGNAEYTGMAAYGTPTPAELGDAEYVSALFGDEFAFVADMLAPQTGASGRPGGQTADGVFASHYLMGIHTWGVRSFITPEYSLMYDLVARYYNAGDAPDRALNAQ